MTIRLFNQLSEMDTEAAKQVFRGVLSSISMQCLMAARQHVQKLRREGDAQDPNEVPTLDKRNEQDEELRGLRHEQQIREDQGFDSNEEPLERAAKLHTLRAKVIEVYKPMITNPDFEGWQTYEELIKNMITNERIRQNNAAEKIVDAAKSAGRNAVELGKQAKASAAKQMARFIEIIGEASDVVSSLDEVEGIDLDTELGLLVEMRFWVAGLNSIGGASDRAFANGTNITFGDEFRKDQLVLSDIYTREGIRLNQAFVAWQKEHSAAIVAFTEKNPNVRMPVLKQNWSEINKRLESPVPEVL